MKKRIKKIIMWMIFLPLSLLLIAAIAVIVFVNSSPQFGQRPIGEDLARISQSKNYGEKGFINQIETTTGDIWAALKQTPKMLFNAENNPQKPLPVDFARNNFDQRDSATTVTWFGHSTFLIELNNQRILIDPMFGEYAAPTSFGTKRFSYIDTIPLNDLKEIDVVIISHDHYDHLDYPSIQKIKDNVDQFITPLGVGSHLKSWGVPAEKIIELDWHESTEIDGIKFIATPARHFSGRGLMDRDATQWASWVLKSPDESIYFSGDGGYGNHFKTIGEKYGPFDFAMLECGQYNQAWKDIHMMPEETVKAGADLNAALCMPIHWGAFRLAPHSWTESVERFKAAAESKKLPFVLPIIGQKMLLGKDYPKENWWNSSK